MYIAARVCGALIARCSSYIINCGRLNAARYDNGSNDAGNKRIFHIITY